MGVKIKATGESKLNDSTWLLQCSSYINKSKHTRDSRKPETCIICMSMTAVYFGLLEAQGTLNKS